MSLPNIKFNISKNGLGLLQAAIEKTPGLIITGVTVVGTNKVTEGSVYQIFSLEEAVTLGIEEANANAFAYKHIKAFYDVALKGAELWFMVVPAMVTLQDMAELTNEYATKLLTTSAGAVNILGFLKQSGVGETITDGLDEDVHLAVPKVQALCEDFALRYYPVRAILSGNKFSGVVADLKDYELQTYNKVAILIANNDASSEASIGLALGRMASIPSQRKISRVKDGSVEDSFAYFTNGEPVETLNTAWDAISDKKYIFLRNFARRSGYYFTGDTTLTASNDDFNSLARGHVMDEAVLIAYNVLVEELSDEVPVTSSGTIQPAIIKGWQNAIEREITDLMVETGKLSAVKALIDETQDVLTTNNVNIDLQLLPVGYSDFITVNIGFTTTIE
ncbi:hypothetical protein FIA58_013830 [Flavobacterium jejuense]|uniref:Tail sheath protein C-terminal domain-containing protein n=1 Tax=Flavobacterium jejuense TaxID=1544455 RepID=A0ABX0IYG0_9FLAO|nr:DUF2586 family protein [Flavobacterium jejuense]NHN26760.1 hypothetical protein [Flavobacterium jejuense]